MRMSSLIWGFRVGFFLFFSLLVSSLQLSPPFPALNHMLILSPPPLFPSTITPLLPERVSVSAPSLSLTLFQRWRARQEKEEEGLMKRYEKNKQTNKVWGGGRK